MKNSRRVSRGDWILPSALLLALCLSISCSGEKPAHPIALWFGGDAHFGAAKSNPLQSLSGHLPGHIKEAVGIVNLEGPIRLPAETVSEKERLRLFNSPRSLLYLKSAGIAVASVANNHQEDAGEQGKRETEELFRRQGILPVGGADPSAVIERGGFRIVVAAYDLSEGVPENLGTELEQARSQGDLMAVAFHVTGPPLYLPTKELKLAVETALVAGADIVVSHGTHAVGPVERRGNRVIAWGLGNLVFECDCTEEREAILLYLTLNPKDTRNPIASACVIPIEAGLQGSPVRPAEDAQEVVDLLKALGSKNLEWAGDRACF